MPSKHLTEYITQVQWRSSIACRPWISAILPLSILGIQCSLTMLVIITRVFLRCFRDPIRVLRIEKWSLESEKIIIVSLESEKPGTYRVPNIFLKKNAITVKYFYERCSQCKNPNACCAR